MANITQFSEAVEDAILNYVIKGISPASRGASEYVGLITAAPGTSAASGTEASYTGYARQLPSWGAIVSNTVLGSGDQIASSSIVTFPVNNSGATITVPSVGLYNALTGGSWDMVINFAAALSIPNGSALQFNTGNLTATVI